MQLTLDRREIRLSNALCDMAHVLADLPVGDILCEYTDGRSTWIAERKTAHDLANSIKSGRWSEQTSRLHSSGFARVFFIIEGDLRSPQFPYASLLGAVLNAELRPRSHVLRSLDLDETAAIVIALCKKAGSTPGIPTGLSPPIAPTSKRKRDSDAKTVMVRQLMCVPSISETTAKALAEHFGKLPDLLEALRDPQKFPRIRLSDRACLGKRRVEILTQYLRPRN